MGEKQYSKGEVIDFVWQYSRYYGNQLAYLSTIEENGHASLIYLTNLLENILKSSVSDYESTFFNIVNKTFEKELINKEEHDFLNNKKIGIRKIRNLLAHANLAKFHIIFPDDKFFYPIVENETCQKLYSILSDVIFNIILKVVSVNFIQKVQLNIDHLIKEINFQIIEVSPEEILTDKGIDVSTLQDWDLLPESDKYRMAENAQNVKALTSLFKHFDIKI